MESNQKSELIDQVIQKLKSSEEGDFDKNNQILLSKLLSELELSKPEASVEQKDVKSPSVSEEEKQSRQINTEEIMKEIREMKKQNVVTHWLLSAMIVLTLAWQVSEVSMLLQLKNGIRHPFKFLGGMLGGFFRVPGISEQDKQPVNSTDPHSSALQMPELPHLPELPLIDMGSNENGKN